MTSPFPGGYDAVLAIDLGTSSVKALLLSPAGDVLAIGKGSHPTHRPHPGWNEQDPADWWAGARTAVREAITAAPGCRIAAIGLTGQMHGTVALDAAGEPVRPAIIWSDRRSEAEREAITADVGPDLANRIGGPLGVGYLATTARWLHDHEPATTARTASLLLPKDALALRLTGEHVTEPSDAISTGLLNAETWTWDDAICAAAGVNRAWLPCVIPSGTIGGRLLADPAAELGLEAGIPVVLAGGDAPCAAFGAGVTSGDEAMVVLSSGAQVILPAPGFAPDPAARWHTFPSAVGRHDHGEQRNRVCATGNAGIALEWLSRLTSTPVATLLDEAATVAPGEEGTLFIPSLTGQRTPVLDALAKGSFFGLADRHERKHLARAVAEGIILACRQALDTIAGEHRPSRIRLGGGPSQHPLMRQLVADILGLPVLPMVSPDLTAIGAARSAALTIGWPDPHVSPGGDAATMTPDPEASARYDAILAIFLDAQEMSRPIAHRLQAVM
ncbi:MAG: FGGY family carbohydrate kinase [Thermomicrobiales bacterium]